MIKINNTRRFILVTTKVGLYGIKFNTTIQRDGRITYAATELKKITGIDTSGLQECPPEIAKKVITSLTNISLEMIKSTGAIPSKQ